MVNDTVAALLSHAYIAPATRFSLIMGTGLNAAVSLPTPALPKNKIPATAPANAQNVLVNTELSMFGKGILPATQWDDMLNNAMERPDFQPFEYLVSGGYLGEILRLIVVESASSKGLFQNILPESWKATYSVETAFLAALEQYVTFPMILIQRSDLLTGTQSHPYPLLPNTLHLNLYTNLILRFCGPSLNTFPTGWPLIVLLVSMLCTSFDSLPIHLTNPSPHHQFLQSLSVAQ